MAWNQPGNNGQNNNPWGNNKNNNKNNNFSFDKLFRRFSKNPFPKKNGHPVPFFIILGVFLTIIGIWFVSGFYTIKEGERAVVTRFGKKLNSLVEPGLNWNPRFIDRVFPIDISTVHGLKGSGIMLTADENVVHVEMNVQYKVTDPIQYLFSVVNADDSLAQATDSAIRAVIGNSTMDKILAEGRTIIRDATQEELIKTIQPYQMGLSVIDVNFQAARPPEQVKAAFDDAIAAREDEQRFIRESEAYSNEILPKAKGQAARVIASAKSYKERIVLEAEGDAVRFEKLLPEYQKSPQVTRERLYLETMEKVLARTTKVIANDKTNNLLMLPIDKMMSGNSANNKIRKSTENAQQNRTIYSEQTPKIEIEQVEQANDSINEQRMRNAYNQSR